MIDYTKEPWEIKFPDRVDEMDDITLLARSLAWPRPDVLPIVFTTPLNAPNGKLAIARIYNVDGLSGTTEGNAKLIRAAPEMAEFLLSGYQHISHGGPTRGDLEDLLRKIGLIS